MDLSVFFDPISEEISHLRERLPLTAWGRHMQAYDQEFPAWHYAEIILVGCTESRGSTFPEMATAATSIRNKLYPLSLPHEEMQVADLGNLKAKSNPDDYYSSLAYVLKQLFEANKTVLLIGGSQDLAYGQYMAYEDQERDIDYVQIDSRFDLEDSGISLHHRSYNHQIFRHEPSNLFQFTNLGYQSYFIDQDQRKILEELDFATVRYGDLHNQIEEAEPYLRTADMLSFDLSAVRHSEAPGSSFPSPGGFSAFEACRLARYAGLSYQLQSVGFHEYNPETDQNLQSALLLATMVWYFVEGFYNRRDDYPREDRSNLRKYSVQLHASVPSIDFYQHPGSGRWWMEVPYPDSIEQPFKRNRLVPCSKKDYEFAQSDDIPDRWWKIHNKLK